MESMFHGTSLFNQDISSWDNNNVTNMWEMFKNTSKRFNQDLSGWDVSNVTKCSEFKLDATNYILPIPNFTLCNNG